MLITGKASLIRIAPRKIMLLAEAVKKLPLAEAIKRLAFLNKSGALELKKVLLQTKANAVNNHKLKEATLTIKEIQIGTGPILKRGRAVARGMYHPIKKRTSNITVILESES